MKNTQLLVVFALLVSVLALQGTQVWTSSSPNLNANEMASTVSTTHMSVYVVFPTSAYPGQTETISLTTTARSDTTIISFSIDVFALIDGQLTKIATQTIVANAYVTVGEEWQTLLNVAIPSGAQNALLMGTITEVWQQTSNYYSPSPYYVTPNYNMPYYAQNYQYYNYNPQQRPYYTQNYQYYNGQQFIRVRMMQGPAPETVRLFNGAVVPVTQRLPNGVVATSSPQTSIVINPQLALPNGNTALQMMPQTQQPFVSRHVTYFVPNYASNYPPNYVPNYPPTYVSNYSPNYSPNYPSYPANVISQQTFALTYILG